MVRAAATQQELQFLIVNETRRLVSYRQAILLIPSSAAASKYDVRAASSVPVVDRTVPVMQWTERLIQSLRDTSNSHDIQQVKEADCPPELQSEWNEFSTGHGLWCPLRHPDGQMLGGLWLTRDQPWPEHEITVLQRLSEAYAYAWRAVGPSKNLRWRWGLSRTTTCLLAGAVVSALIVPVPMSTVAPARLWPRTR